MKKNKPFMRPFSAARKEIRACLILMLGFTLSAGFIACDDDNEEFKPEGQYRREMVLQLEGFGEEKADLLTQCHMDQSTFIELSTSPAWELTTDKQTALKEVRDGVSKPESRTLLQKVIPLSDVYIYMENVYGGTIGGFVCEAADVKQLITMYDVFWGMRLDYEGTNFHEEGAGYAVIRFYSDSINHLSIPYVEELGGTQPHQWPNGGGGFTTSTLGEGGYPEWTFDGYYAPKEGAELYEVTPQGRELLRATYTAGKWQTFESTNYPAPSQLRSSLSGTRSDVHFVDYAGHRFMVRGEDDTRYLLATYELLDLPGMFLLEKGIRALWVEKETILPSDNS